MKRLTFAAVSILTAAVIVSPLTALNADAQLFESTPPENADPAVTDSDTTDPDYEPTEASAVDESMESDGIDDPVSQELDGEPDGEALEPEFEEENNETLNNS